MTRLAPRAAVARLAADSSLAGVIGAGRRAAWRRHLIRRGLAGLLVLAALVIALTQSGWAPAGRLGAAGSSGSAGSSGAAGSAQSGSSGPDATGDDALLRGLGAGGGGAPAPSGAAARPGSQPPAPGSSALPPGRLGVVIPLGADLASRLRAGDLVDVYALGSKSALTRGAYVVDVTRPADDSMALGYAGSGGGAGGAGAAVFLAIDPADASRISAGQSTGSAGDGFLLALSPRRAVAAGAGASPS